MADEDLLPPPPPKKNQPVTQETEDLLPPPPKKKTIDGSSSPSNSAGSMPELAGTTSDAGKPIVNAVLPTAQADATQVITPTKEINPVVKIDPVKPVPLSQLPFFQSKEDVIKNSLASIDEHSQDASAVSELLNKSAAILDQQTQELADYEKQSQKALRSGTPLLDADKMIAEKSAKIKETKSVIQGLQNKGQQLGDSIAKNKAIVETPPPTFWESVKNTGVNIGTQIEEALPKLKIAAADTWEFALGKELAGKWYNLEGRDIDKVRTDAYKALEELQLQEKETRGIVESFEKNDAVGIVAGVVDAIGGLVSTIVPAMFTGGATLFTDPVGQSIVDANKALAESSGKSVDEIYKEGKQEFMVPATIGTIIGALELWGLKGIGKAAGSNKIFSDGLRKATIFASEINKEGLTEWIEMGLEEYNKAITEEDVVNSTARALDKMWSKEGLETYLKGLAASGSAAVSGKGVRSVIKNVKLKAKVAGIETKVQTLNNDIKNPNVSAETKAAIKKNIDTEISNLAQAVEDDAKAEQSLSKEDKSKVSGIDKAISEKESIVADPNVSMETKAVLQGDIETLSQESEKIHEAAAATEKEAVKEKEGEEKASTDDELQNLQIMKEGGVELSEEEEARLKELRENKVELPPHDLKEGDKITGKIGPENVSGIVIGVAEHKGKIVIDFIDDKTGKRFIYANQIENIEPGKAKLPKPNPLSEADQKIDADLTAKVISGEDFSAEEMDEMKRIYDLKIKSEATTENKPAVQSAPTSKKEVAIQKEVVTKKESEPAKKIVEPKKPVSEMNSEEMQDYSTEVKNALKKQDKEFKDKTEKEKEDAGYYDYSDDVEDLRDASQKINFIENSEDLEDLANSTKSALRDFNKEKPSEYSLAILNAVKNKASELNINTEDLIKKVIKKVGSQYSDASDAEVMTRAYLEKINLKPIKNEEAKTETKAEVLEEPETKKPSAPKNELIDIDDEAIVEDESVTKTLDKDFEAMRSFKDAKKTDILKTKYKAVVKRISNAQKDKKIKRDTADKALEEANKILLAGGIKKDDVDLTEPSKTESIVEQGERAKKTVDEVGKKIKKILKAGISEDITGNENLKQKSIVDGDKLIDTAIRIAKAAIDKGVDMHIAITQALDKIKETEAYKRLVKNGLDEKKFEENVRSNADPDVVHGEKETADRQKKGIIETVLASEKTTGEMSTKTVELDPFYDVVHNDEAIKKANELIGLDLNEAKKKAMDKSAPTAHKSALNILLIKHFEKIKDFDSAIEVLNSYDKQLREAGQFTQAASLWNKASPEVVVRNAKKVAEDLGMKLTDEDLKEVLKRLNEVDAMEEGQAKQEATLEALNYIAEKLPPTLGEKFDAYRYSNMLSNPKTHIKNIYGSLFNTFLTMPSNIGLNAAYDLMRHPLNAAAREYKFSDIPAYIKPAFANIPNALVAAQETFKNSFAADKILETEKTVDRIELLRKAKLPKAITTVTRFLEAQDRFFTELIASGERARLIKNGVEESEATEKAKALATEYLCRDKMDASDKSKLYMERALDALGQGMNMGRRLPIVGKPFGWFVPFVTTPINVAKLSVKYSPLAMVDIGVGKLMGKEVKKSQVSAAAIGSMMMGYGAYLAMNGLTTWAAPEDKEERELFYASGRKPYSIKVGNKWIPIQYLGPLGLSLALPASVKHYYSETKESVSDSDAEKIGKAIMGSAGMIMETTPMQGVTGFYQAISGDIDKDVMKHLGYTTGQLIPANGMVKYVNTIMDPIYRKSKGYLESIESGLPVLSENLKPYMTLEGEPAKREKTNYFTPYDVGFHKEEYDEMLKTRKEALKESQTEKNAKPEYSIKVPSVKIVNGKKQETSIETPLTQKLYLEYNKAVGESRKEADKYMEANEKEEIKGLSASEKIKWARKKYEEYKSQATQDFLDNYPDIGTAAEKIMDEE